MQFKKIWISPDTGKKSRYAWQVLGGILAIVTLMMLLIGGGVALSFQLGAVQKVFDFALCMGVTGLAVWLALRVGWRSVGQATVFFLAEDDKLYVVDARMLSDHGHGLMGYVAGAAQTQAFLRRLSEKPFLPAEADEIAKVGRIRENRAYYAIRCWVRRPGRRAAKHTYFLVKGYEDEQALLHQLERRKNREITQDTENRNGLFLFISTWLLIGFGILCVLSHPAFGKLPQGIYFPCLGAAFVAFYFFVYFLIRIRRGE